MKHITYSRGKGCKVVHKHIKDSYPRIKSSDGKVAQVCGECGVTWIDGIKKTLKTGD